MKKKEKKPKKPRVDFSKVLRELRRFNYLTFYCSKCHPCFCKFLCSSNYQGKEKESFWAHKHRSSQHLTVSFTELLQFALKAQKESMKYEFYFVAQLVSSSLRNIYCTLQYFFIHLWTFQNPFTDVVQKNPSNSYKSCPSKSTTQNAQEIYILVLHLSPGWAVTMKRISH